MTPTSVGMRCPECSRDKTRVVRRAYAGGEPIVTYTLIAMNVLVFFAELATGASVGGSVGGNSVLSKAALNGPAVANGDWYRIITAAAPLRTRVRCEAHSGQRIPTGVEVMHSGQIGRPQLEQETPVSRLGCR